MRNQQLQELQPRKIIFALPTPVLPAPEPIRFEFCGASRWHRDCSDQLRWYAQIEPDKRYPARSIDLPRGCEAHRSQQHGSIQSKPANQVRKAAGSNRVLCRYETIARSKDNTWRPASAHMRRSLLSPGTSAASRAFCPSDGPSTQMVQTGSCRPRALARGRFALCVCGGR